MLIAVTGQIGAGKTAVVELLKEYGCRVVDADEVGKRVTGSPPVLKKLMRRFGPDIASPGGRLRPAKLGGVIFADKSGGSLAFLNELVRPRLVSGLRREISAALRQRPKRPVVLDAALLPDWDHGLDIDLTVLVTARREKRISRLRTRGISSQQARERMRAQRTLADYRSIADVVLTNDGSRAALRTKVGRLWRRRIGPHL